MGYSCQRTWLRSGLSHGLNRGGGSLGGLLLAFEQIEKTHMAEKNVFSPSGDFFP